MFIGSANAALFTDKEFELYFNSSESQEELKVLNRNLTTSFFLHCDFNIIEECLDQVNGHTYALDYNNFEIRKIEYIFDQYGSAQIDIVPVESHYVKFFELFSRKIQREFDKFNIKSTTPNFSIVESLSSTSQITPNGCGTPDHLSYDVIPNKPYKAACDNHDICYTTDTPKSVCDKFFKQHMDDINDKLGLKLLLEFDGIAARLAAIAALRALANTFYAVVKYSDSALKAYCANKDAECIARKGEPSSSSGASGGGREGGSIGGGREGPCMTIEYWQVCTGGGCNYYTTTKMC